MILGITGRASAGKDTIADRLVAGYGAVKVALADPMKRTVMEIYGFTAEQLWGPSSKRDEPDKRYPREHGPWKEVVGKEGLRCACCGIRWSFNDPHEPKCYLTPRFALKLLGTEWGRTCFEDTWVRKTLAVVGPILDYNGDYDKVTGLCKPAAFTVKAVVVPDLRYDNEARAIHAAGGWIVRKAGHEDDAVTHTSEAGISKDLIDYELSWWEDPADVGREKEIETMMEQLKGRRT